jgi:hypothetical protein
MVWCRSRETSAVAPGAGWGIRTGLGVVGLRTALRCRAQEGVLGTSSKAEVQEQQTECNSSRLGTKVGSGLELRRHVVQGWCSLWCSNVRLGCSSGGLRCSSEWAEVTAAAGRCSSTGLRCSGQAGAAVAGRGATLWLLGPSHLDDWLFHGCSGLKLSEYLRGLGRLP